MHKKILLTSIIFLALIYLGIYGIRLSDLSVMPIEGLPEAFAGLLKMRMLLISFRIIFPLIMMIGLIAYYFKFR